MKITLNKKVITLAEVEEAKALAADYKSWVTPSILEFWANLAAGVDGWKLMQVQKMEVEKNHYELTIWAECILMGFDGFCIVSFDACQANSMAYGGKVDAFVQRFTCTSTETISYQEVQEEQ